MYSRVITQTEPLTTHLRLRSNTNLVPSASNEQASRGPLNYIPLAPDEEHYIANRIEILRLQGADEKIIQLIMEMQADTTLSIDTQEQVKEWIKQFFALDQSDTESLSLSIAFLIIKILRPALGQENYDGQNLLIDWEDACQEILSLFLINEQVEIFLDECDKHLVQEDLVKSICKKADEALKLLNQTFERLLLRNDRQIDQAYQTFRQRLSLLQENRQQGSDAIVADMHCLIEDIEQLAAAVMSTAIENSQDLCKELAAVQMVFDNQLEEYKHVIQKVSYER